MYLCNALTTRIVVLIFHIGTESELLERWLKIERYYSGRWPMIPFLHPVASTFFFFLGKTTLDHVRDSKGIRSGLDMLESESNHVDFGPGPRSWIQILNWAKPICGDSGLLLDYGLIAHIWVFHNQY